MQLDLLTYQINDKLIIDAFEQKIFICHNPNDYFHNKI